MRTSFALAALAATTLASPINGRQSQGNTTIQNPAKWSDLRGKIKHVVYLMLENRSFSNVAGAWTFNNKINNLANRKEPFCNDYISDKYTIYGEPLSICAGPHEAEVPLRDPDHNFAGTSYELYQKFNPSKNDSPTMQGFIQREADKYNSTPGNASFVIQYADPQKSSILEYLAQNFGFWDSYFAEHPGPTNINRMFATSGSSCGMVDNSNLQSAGFFNNVTGASCAESIFESLDKKNISWKNYYETDIVDAFLYKYVQDHAMNKLVHADQFYKDLANGTLPAFSYYNVECCSVDSMHPSSTIAAGEQLIRHVYNAIRQSKHWDDTLFILNFDEHGGFADDVAPPTNVVAPQDGLKFNGTSEGYAVQYDFTRLGVRVPAFVINKWIKPGTLIQTNDGTSYSSNSAWTHTSFLHFLQNLWELPGLNNRVQWAKTFENVFTDTEQNAPSSLPKPVWEGGSNSPAPPAFYKLNQDYSYYASQ